MKLHFVAEKKGLKSALLKIKDIIYKNEKHLLLDKSEDAFHFYYFPT